MKRAVIFICVPLLVIFAVVGGVVIACAGAAADWMNE